MSKIIDKLYFYGPSALGDYFVMSGIIHHYSDICEELHLPCWEEHEKSIKTLFKDCPNIKIPIFEHNNFNEEAYIAHHRLSRTLRTNILYDVITGVPPYWDYQIYEHYNIPFEKRYSNFRMPSNIEGSDELYYKLSNGEPYILVHKSNGASNGNAANHSAMDIGRFRGGYPNVKIIEIDPELSDYNMLKLTKLVENALEIHCVGSSFFCFVDSIHNRTNAALFYHDLRKNTLMRVNSKYNNYRWIYIHYPDELKL
jgi:hypothetical protein